MSKVAPFHKNRIELTEYNVAMDIQNRVLMSSFTRKDIEILEEILYSSLRIPLSTLEKNLNLDSIELQLILEKFAKTSLFKIEENFVVVNKEIRKYYEQQILKFEKGFKPGMEYIQNLLRKVPIHILPNWYVIPRSSNNIFHSIVEKYCLSPQTFQRYLFDLDFPDPVQKGIMTAVYQSPNFEVEATSIIDKYNLSRAQFEEHMIYLEFHFVCCVKFVQIGDRFKELISPFYEWHQYLLNIRRTEANPIIDEEAILRKKRGNFGVIEEISTMLELALQSPLEPASLSVLQKKYPDLDQVTYQFYTKQLCRLNLTTLEDGMLCSTSKALDWLHMPLNERALYIYHYPSPPLISPHLPEKLIEKRVVREAEKCVSRIAGKGWVLLDEFLEGIFIPLSKEHFISLKRKGSHWEYFLPRYSIEEKSFFSAVIQVWLFQIGATALGLYQGRDCFTLTPFGEELFGNE